MSAREDRDQDLVDHFVHADDRLAQFGYELFSRQTMTGWSFDIELLFIARRHGYTIKEIGIPWYYSDYSHVDPVKDALRMLADIGKMWINAVRGCYK